MGQKKLVNNTILLLIILLFISCNKKINTEKLFNQKIKYQQIDNYSDDADVCKFKSYKLSSLNMEQFKREFKNISIQENFETQNNWESVEWGENNISKRIQQFISPNFINYSIDQILAKYPVYYSTFTYQKGSNNEINALMLYLFIPEKGNLYYYEIIP